MRLPPREWAGEVEDGRQCPSDESGSQPFRVCTASHDPQPFGVSAKQTGYDDNPRRQGRSIFGANSAQLVPKTLRQTSVHRSANSLCRWITESCAEVKSSAQITTFCALDKYGSSHWPAVLSTLKLLRCRECRCTWAACKSKRREPKYSVHRVPLRSTSRASRSSILQACTVAAQTDSFEGIPLQPAHTPFADAACAAHPQLCAS